MLQVTPQMKVLVATEPIDFRCGIDGIAQRCRSVLSADPFSGVVFVFRNRRQTSVKVLVYDGRGFWLCHKRLSQGRFRWWPQAGESKSRQLEAHQLAVLLSGGNAEQIDIGPLWRGIVPKPLAA
jgi:transposase